MNPDDEYYEQEERERRRLLPRRNGRLLMQGPLIWGLLALLVLFYLNGALRGTTDVATAEPTTYQGIFTPENGDTVILGADRFRLWGIDAPNEDGPASEYYVQSGAALLTATSYPWTCEDTGVRSSGRIVAKCKFDNGAGSLSAWMVRNGYAVDWPSISGGEFADEQSLARAEGLGIWQTETRSWR